jgi:DNA polymerase-3 subunit alpha
MGLKVVPPSVNTSHYKFTVRADNAVVYGLGAIKGVGEGAIEGIVSEREAHGPYADLFDFCKRIDLKKANRRVLEALIRAGALDGLGPNRATLMAALPQALQVAEQHMQNHQAGVEDLFGFEPAGAADASGPTGYEEVPEWNDEIRLNGEKETLGLYLTGHPIDRYLTELARFTSCRLAQLAADRPRAVTVAGLVVALRTRPTKRGDRMAFVTLDDRSGRLEVTMFGDTYARFQHLIAQDKVLVVKGEARHDDYSGGLVLRAEDVFDLELARNHFAKRLVVAVDEGKAGNGFADSLERVLGPYCEGRCPVQLDYARRDARVRLALGEQWRVRPSEELLHRLQQLAGPDAVRLEY